MTTVYLSQVRILAFKSPDCQQCRQLQEPALQRVLQVRGDVVAVVNVDATSEHELVQTYRVLTPSTVLLDATGQAQAINYGFTNRYFTVELTTFNKPFSRSYGTDTSVHRMI